MERIVIIALTFVNKPGRSGSDFSSELANNGPVVPKVLLNIHFQTGCVIF